MTTEPVDIKKVVDVSPTTLVKTSSSTAKGLMVILGVLAILFCIGYTGYTLFRKPKPTQPITVQSGGLVNVINEANKRHLILFAEPYVFTQTSNGGEAGIGIRGGCRWEF